MTVNQHAQKSLYALNKEIREAMQLAFPENTWVVAEINHLSINRSGHCYLELIEKSSGEDKIIAQANGIIWAYTFRMLAPYFETSTGRKLEKGLKVLVNVSVEFHEQYGFSLNIKDIDPTYTVGELELRRQQIIQKLQEMGIYDMNKMLPEELVYQRIAVISSENAAGFGDFINQLDSNPHGYQYNWKLFPAIMQGESAAQSIIRAMDAVFELENDFDCLLILRGGGSKTDLACFDDFDLAVNISQFSLPVICGIGHERDQSIADLVAHTSLKTPTAVAEYLIDKMHNFETSIADIGWNILESIEEILDSEKQLLDRYREQLSQNLTTLFTGERLALAQYSSHATVLSERILTFQRENLKRKEQQLIFAENHIINSESRSIMLQQERFKRLLNQMIERETTQMNIMELKIHAHDPSMVLKKGYALIKANGHYIHKPDQFKEGMNVEIHTLETIADATVNKIKPNTKQP